MRSGRGQYDVEYKNCPCFWGVEPAKYVKVLAESALPTGRQARALDLGAGEGKNAFFLRGKGYDVTAVEISRYACAHFIERMIDEELDDGITLILGDVRSVPLEPAYDVVVAYGLLHCLSSLDEVMQVVSRMQEVSRVGGINVVSAFTNRLPVPDIQDYLSPTLLPEDHILSLYGEHWAVLRYENDILTETHPTSNVEHQHSLFRLIARREV
ncbi:MAG TPA: methyltransferase domain-containing protein [Thermoanaerobaculia bacterium]|jgi:SAM-dependent methyltransferase|nr:methyltransferase domain-containing protein [Thermoanaerobaculia bacterium]